MQLANTDSDYGERSWQTKLFAETEILRVDNAEKSVFKGMNNYPFVATAANYSLSRLYVFAA